MTAWRRGHPQEHLANPPPPACYQVFLTSWQGLQCRQDPRSCCLLNVWAYFWYFCGNFFPWGSATAGARGVNSINICQVLAWYPAVLEGTLECRVQVGGVGGWYGHNGFPEATWTEILPSTTSSQFPCAVGSSSLEQSLRRDKAGGLSREVGWSGGHCPAFSEGRDGRNLRSATGRHDLNLSHGEVGKGRSGAGGWQPELC